MSEKELYDLIKVIQVNYQYIPVYYDHYESDADTPNLEPPFILYRVEDTDNLMAEDQTYFSDNNFIVDLVVTHIDKLLEAQLEKIFNDNFIPWDKEVDYLSNERIYQVRYYL